jgi:PAS domain S-box-containing protein
MVRICSGETMAEKPTYAELEQRVKQLSGKVSGLERAELMNQTLYRVSSAVNTTENLDELYASIHGILHDVIELDNFFIAIYHRDNKALSFPYFKDEFDDDWSYIEDFTETNSLTGEVILAGKPLLLTKEMLEKRSREDRVMGTVPVVWMGFPLKVRGAVIGVMATQSYSDPDQFSRHDFEIMTSVSDQIAIAIERKRIEEALVESENRFRSMADAMPCAIYRCALDADWTMAFISQQILEITGYPATDFIDNAVRSFASIIHPDDVARVDDGVRAAVVAQTSWVLDYRVCHADGSIRSVYEEGRAICADDGDIRFLDGFILDNTERQLAEESLRKSEERYRTLLEASPDAIVAYDQKGSIIYINPAFEKTYGWSAAELAGHKIDFVPDHEKEKTRHAVMRNLNGEDVSLVTQRLAKDGRLLDIHLKTAIFHDDEGDLQGSIVIHRDITERRKTEAERERLIAIVENTSDMVSSALPDGRILYMNRSGREMVGWDLDGPLINKFIPDIHPSWALKVIETEGIPTAIEKGLWNGETALLDPRGSEVPVSQVIMSHKGSDGQIDYLSTIIRDITASIEAEQETKRLQNLLGNIVDSMPSILVGIDDAGRVTQWNRRAEEETGIAAAAAAGCKIGDVFPRLADEMEKIRMAMQERQPQHDPKKPYRGAAETRYEDVTVYPLTSNGVQGAVIRLDDVTERVRLEEMMIQSEKMMSVGGLAAGMAHEINNPLAGIMQNTQIARNRLSCSSPADQRAATECGTTIEAIKAFHKKRGLIAMLEAALASGARAAKIVNNMLSFSRMGDASMTRQDLAKLLDATIELAQSDYDLKRKHDFRKIEIVRDYDPDTPQVLCAGSKIQQVFLNILKNGAEAMASRETRAMPPRFHLRVLPEKDMVRVEIKDNGPGMEAGVRKRVFEPFYTTKSGEGGTGLGLSVSYFIITDNHQGAMMVESEAGKGARFIIRLPC